MRPIVSVIMPVFNQMQYVGVAIESILKQSMNEFELIIIDDGSSDSSNQIISSFKDKRLTHLRLPVNCGQAISRNIGISMARGPFIAIMDSDDIAAPNRLEKQLTYFESHTEVDILGSYAIKIIGDEKVFMKHPERDEIIKAKLLLLNGSSMIHPTTMVKTKFLKDNDIRYQFHKTDSDHGLWINATLNHGNFANLPEHLLTYRRHPGNVTSELNPDARGHEQRKTKFRISVLQMYFPKLTFEECQKIASVMEKNRSHSSKSLLQVLQCIAKAMEDNQSYYGESKEELFKILAQLNSAVKGTLEK